MQLLNKHWEANKQARQKERWSTGNVYVNWWESPTYMVSVEDSNLRGGGSLLKQKVWDEVQPVVEEWTGMELKPASQYGIRIYTEGAVLSPHVDRIPLISSCIINVAQDVDEPWPLEVIDRQGRAVNVTMEPGDMVLYESHSLIHARPFPLKGRYMANIFIHFEPTGRPLSDTTSAWMAHLPDFLPPYIVEGSAWARKWARENPNGWHRPAPSGPKLQTDTTRESHVAAALNDLDALQHIAVHKPQLLHKADENGWHPLHESARSGHKDAAELLVQHGGEVNARTGRYKNGQSVLNLALEHHPEESDIVQYLRSIGAQDIAMEEL
jgi:prolyl 4-hydroxylase